MPISSTIYNRVLDNAVNMRAIIAPSPPRHTHFLLYPLTTTCTLSAMFNCKFNRNEFPTRGSYSFDSSHILDEIVLLSNVIATLTFDLISTGSRDHQDQSAYNLGQSILTAKGNRETEEKKTFV